MKFIAMQYFCFMDLRAYLYTVNKSRGFRLSPDELKDVQQDTEIKLFQKDYNDQITRLTMLSLYRSAVQKKIRDEKIAQEQKYILDPEETTDLEIQQEREKRISVLTLSDIQKKIVKLLVIGLSYEEIRKKLKLSQRQLIDHCKAIRKKNS